MTFSGAFLKPFRPVFDPGLAVAAAAAWYVVAGKTCVAAYQPKGAASLEASYSNLANPGTYDAAPGTAPTWDATNGWTFNGSTQYLTTGVVPGTNQTWSIIARFSSASGNCTMIGSYNDDPGNATFGLNSYDTDNVIRYYNHDTSSPLSVAPALASGVLAVAGRTGYRNGVADSGSIPEVSLTSPRSIYVGAWNSNYGPFYASVAMQAVAIYSATLTSGEIGTVSTAMAAL